MAGGAWIFTSPRSGCYSEAIEGKGIGMPWFDFFWTVEIVEHLGLHGVSPAEFEDIVEHARSVSVSRTSERYVVLGTTSAGRWLVCVF